jgi:hypothetical protein
MELHYDQSQSFMDRKTGSISSVLTNRPVSMPHGAATRIDQGASPVKNPAAHARHI